MAKNRWTRAKAQPAQHPRRFPSSILDFDKKSDRSAARIGAFSDFP
jgi:hypothetical protein